MKINTTKRHRYVAAVVAIALLCYLEQQQHPNNGSIDVVDAFLLPSSPLSNTIIPNFRKYEQEEEEDNSSSLLRSIKFVKSQTTYEDSSSSAFEPSLNSGMLNGGFNGGSGIGGGGVSSSRSRRASSNRRRNRFPSWWSGFSRSTPTTSLAAGSLESWPVMEETTEDIQILVKKGEDDNEDNEEYTEGSSSSSSVRATLERWERDLSLPVVGNDNDGYSMLGNERQPRDNSNSNDQCTQSVQFDVSNGDLYPFSGTVSVPPTQLTVEDQNTGNQQSVMMVMHNPDDEQDDNYSPSGLSSYPDEYDEYGNAKKKKKKPSSSTLEARLEPSVKKRNAPKNNYNQGYNNDNYNDQQQQQQPSTTTISSNGGSQSFQLDATDPSTGKIKIHLERSEEGNGGGGGRNAMGSPTGEALAPWEARVEIHHGFRDDYGNNIQINSMTDEDSYSTSSSDISTDRRISMDVSTIHPTFSSTVDTMPPKLLYQHISSSSQQQLNQEVDMQSIQPYLEVRIVNTGGIAVRANVDSVVKQNQYQSKSSRQQQQQQYQQQQKQQQRSNSFSPKADDPFLLNDSAQSTGSKRRLVDPSLNIPRQQQQYERAYVGNVGRADYEAQQDQREQQQYQYQGDNDERASSYGGGGSVYN